MRLGKRAKRWILKSSLPEDALTGAARITLHGNSTALIEGQRGVVEMCGTCIRLKSRSGVVSIRGNGLMLKELSVDAAMVQGAEISAVSYE